MLPNILVLVGCAFVPFLLGYIWFGEALFGVEKWAKIARLNKEAASKKVSIVKVIATLIPNFLIAFGLYNVVVHGAGVFGMVGADTELLTTGTAAAFLDDYGTNFLTFKHGVLHGILPGFVCFVLPILIYVMVFERKPVKYLWVYSGYWIISLGIMGGIISKWGWVLVS